MIKAKRVQQAHDGQQECLGRQALGSSSQAVATACLNAAMHWENHHRLQLQVAWEPPGTQKPTKGIACRVLRC